MRIANGWPPNPTPTPLPPPSKIKSYQARIQQHAIELDKLMAKPETQQSLYDFCRENRDLDVQTFRQWILFYISEYKLKPLYIADGEIWNSMVESVRNGSKIFT